MRMSNLRTWLFALFGLGLSLFAAGSADAALYGTPAWTNEPLNLRSGPGMDYQVIGTIDGEIRTYVDRCTGRWCQIQTRSGLGWVRLGSLSFGRFPGNPFFNDRPSIPSGHGEVCFYSGANYTGVKSCAGPGFTISDLALYGTDNRIGSVQLTGRVSVTLCRDFDFSSYCDRIVTSTPRLNGFLYHAVSSFKVH